MKLMGTLLIGLLLSNATYAQNNTKGVSAKVAELSLHRVEKLVLLNQIDSSFQASFRKIEFTDLTQQNPSDPVYLGIAEQYPGQNGLAPHKLELYLDKDGKTLKNKVVQGNDATGFPNWPDKDALTLSENAMHYILEHNQHFPVLQLFLANIKTVTLSAGADDNGQMIAYYDVDSYLVPNGLRIELKTDGSVIRAYQRP